MSGKTVEEHKAELLGKERNIEYVYARSLWPKIRHLQRLITAAEVRPEVTKAVANMKLPRAYEDSARQLNEFKELVRPFLDEHDEFRNLDANDTAAIVSVAYWEVIGLSVLYELWWDVSITEIMVDAFDAVTVERGGKLIRTSIRFQDEHHVREIAKRIAKAVSDRDLSPANPLTTAELPGARVALAIDRVVKSGVSISIRKFPPLMGMQDLLGFGALTEEMRDFLAAAVEVRANVLISGGTGTGKTTFINSVSEFIPQNERVITIEDAYELSLKNQHWVAMQSREKSGGDDTVSVTLADLLRATLRMRPDRIVVGEIREAAGAAVMLQAANTGHDGTMTTIHANSAERAVNFRLPGLLRKDKESGGMPQDVAVAEVASAIEIVIQISREHGRRFVKEISVCDVSRLSGSHITLSPIFEGELNTEGVPTFKRVGSVPADTSMGMKLLETPSGVPWVQEA